MAVMQKVQNPPHLFDTEHRERLEPLSGKGPS